MKTIEDLFIDNYNSGKMCKGCLTKVMSCFDYQCPICEV